MADPVRKKPVLQVLAKSVGDGHRDYERSDAGCDAGNRDASDDADEGLASFGSEIPRRDEKFEAHGPLSAVSLEL